MVATGPASILLGDMAIGQLAASYGGYGAAILETWRKTDFNDWCFYAPCAPPDTVREIDTNIWTVCELPDLGGSAFFYEGPARLAGVRLKPPPLDPHVYHRERKEKKQNDEDGDPDVAVKSNNRVTNRKRSCMRYTRFRDDNNDHAQDQRRGRPRSRNPPSP